jgi:hypothetical protein
MQRDLSSAAFPWPHPVVIFRGNSFSVAVATLRNPWSFHPECLAPRNFLLAFSCLVLSLSPT